MTGQFPLLRTGGWPWRFTEARPTSWPPGRCGTCGRRGSPRLLLETFVLALALPRCPKMSAKDHHAQYQREDHDQDREATADPKRLGDEERTKGVHGARGGCGHS